MPEGRMYQIPTLSPRLVSVVIPCYNQAAFLSEAVESVLSQTHRRVEILVDDDGSTDGTVAVARSYEGVRCISQANQGQGTARNEGLKRATGEYVVFLDSDDRPRPRALEVGVRCLEYVTTARWPPGVASLSVPMARDSPQGIVPSSFKITT